MSAKRKTTSPFSLGLWNTLTEAECYRLSSSAFSDVYSATT